MSNALSLTHRSGHPPPPPQPTLSSQVLAEAQGQEPIPKSRAFQKLNSPQRAPGAQPSPTHSPYPEAKRARLPGGARGFVLRKRPGPSKSSDLGGVLLRQKRADRSGLTTGKSSFSEGQKSPGRRQRGEKGVLVLSEKLLGTPEVTSKVHPPFGGGPEDGVLKAGRPRGRRWEWAWGGAYAPRGATVPGASVPGKGCGGRSFSDPFPASSRVVFSPSPPPQGREER